MKILKCEGFVLEKTLPNTSEDFFNQSMVTYVENGLEKSFVVTYVRTFEDRMHEYTSFTGDPVFEQQGKQCTLKDIVALAVLFKDEEMKKRRRLYINDYDVFTSYLQGSDFIALMEAYFNQEPSVS